MPKSAPLILLTLLILTGCEQRLPLTIPPAAPVTIANASTQETLLPADHRYAALQRWLAANQTGWSPLMSTAASGGSTFVNLGTIRLQFQNHTVYAETASGTFIRSFDPANCPFLDPAPIVPPSFVYPTPPN